MAEFIRITDGKKIIKVSERAFNVVYKGHGFTIYEEKKEETKSKKTTAKKKKTTNTKKTTTEEEAK